MEVFVRRRGENAAEGPFTIADVKAMRIRWEISDADYFRRTESQHWHLVGDLEEVTARQRRRLFSAGVFAAACVAAALFVVISSPDIWSSDDQATDDDATSLATSDSTDDEETHFHLFSNPDDLPEESADGSLPSNI